MDPLFWILAGVVVGCVIGIIIIWRLEGQAERRAADTQRVEAQVSARLKIFDPRAVVEEIDTRPIPAAPTPASPTNGAQPLSGQQTNHTATANGAAERPIPPEVLQTTPERALQRAAQLGRERRYLEQAIEDQQARLAELLHSDPPDASEAAAAISQLQTELAQQREHLQETIFLEERYRQVAVPTLEQLAQHYKNTASAHTPRAFGVRRHSLARVKPPDQNPPAPPAQATTDSPS
ncbi:MAG TPA: hypothetical protein VH599_11810 [Ktedonobacterales bacterium]|jgi:hypothetical protein